MESERSDSTKPATLLSFQDQALPPDIDLGSPYVELQEEDQAIPIPEARELDLLNEDVGFESESSRPSPVISAVEQGRASRLTPPGRFLSEAGSETGGVPISEKPQPQTLPESEQRLSPLAPQPRQIPKPSQQSRQSFPTSFEQNRMRSPNTAAAEWTRTLAVPNYPASPSNLINLSESPQTVPCSYEDKSLFAGYQPSGSDRDRRANRAETQYSQSTSPPIHAPLPPSLLNNNNFNRRPMSGQSQLQRERRSMFEDDRLPRQPQNTNRQRRNSGYSQFTDRLRTPPQHAFSPPTHAPPPISTYYGGSCAPDINVGGGRRTNGLKPGQRGYYVGFDTMNIVRGGRAENKSVVITGFEGGLNVRHVSKLGSVQIAQLGGLRGGVYAAKILPWTIDHGPNITRGSTLVAVVVHGPVLEDANEVVTFGEEAGDGVNKRPSGTSTTETEQKRKAAVTHYQTTVEVYDMRTQKYIATLLTVPKVELGTTFMGPRFSPPPPSGGFSIDADRGNVVVTSGQTGEVWIFTQAEIKGEEPVGFRALGKIWTTVQQPSVNEGTDYSQQYIGSERGGNSNEQVKKTRARTGLISLRGRWLVYCPSPNIHAISLRASVDLNRSPKSGIASINSYAPPQLPSPNCAVDTPPGASLTSRLGRQAAQGAIVGATYLAGQGTKLFNNYWKPPSPTAQGWTPGPGEPIGQMFPPTHSSSSAKEITASEAVTVSLIDLHRLATLPGGKKNSHATISTFKLPEGCSYLSLSPSGLQLFTANSRGDMHYIWDLMKMQYPKPSTLTLPRPAYPTQAHIRQIYRFERLTVSRIVDVVWTFPRGSTIAMVTERNTVHFFDIPGQVFSWPPPRRIRATIQGTDNNGLRAVSAAPVVAARLASSVAGSAFSTVKGITGWGRRSSQNSATLAPSSSNLSSMSGANGNTPAPNRSGALAATLSSYAGAGAKMAASGISKSLNSTMQTVQTLRRSNDNKLHLPDSTSSVQPGCMAWLGEKRGSKQAFAAVLDGVVKVHTVEYVKGKAGGKGRKREPPRVVVKNHVKDIGLPSISDSMVSEVVRQALELDVGELRMASPSVRNADDNSRTATLPRIAPLTRRPVGRVGGAHPITMAEINTSTPYSPFINDHRFTLYTYSAPHDEDENWTFGGTIEGERVDCGFDEDEEREVQGYSLERTVSRDGEEPIVSTTRRRHRKGLAALGKGVEERREDEEREGFFDEDVEWVDLE